MIIACPQCKTGFFVPPEKIGKDGRKVKCSKCQHIWLATVPEEVLRAAQMAIAHDEAYAKNLPAVIPVKLPLSIFILPPVLLVLIIFTVWSLFPESMREMGVCGNMCISKDLKISGTNFEFDPDAHKMTVTYKVVNFSNKPVTVPGAEVRLFEKGAIVQSKANPPVDSTTIAPGKSVTMKTEFTEVPRTIDKGSIMLGSGPMLWFR